MPNMWRRYAFVSIHIVPEKLIALLNLRGANAIRELRLTYVRTNEASLTSVTIGKFLFGLRFAWLQSS